MPKIGGNSSPRKQMISKMKSFKNQSSTDLMHDTQWGISKKREKPLVKINSDLDEFISKNKSRREFNSSYQMSKTP